MKKELTAEEKQRRNEIIKERERQRRAFLILCVVSFLISYAVLFSSLILIRVIDYNSSAYETEYDIRLVRYTKSNKYSTVTYVDSDDAYIDGELYVSLSALDSILGFSVAGDSEKITVIFRECDEYFTISANDSYMVINGVPVRLAYPVLSKNDEFYFPVEFVNDYLRDVTVDYRGETCFIYKNFGADYASLVIKPNNPLTKLKEPQKK